MREPRQPSGAMPTFTLALVEVREQVALLERRLEVLSETVEWLVVTLEEMAERDRSAA